MEGLAYFLPGVNLVGAELSMYTRLLSFVVRFAKGEKTAETKCESKRMIDPNCGYFLAKRYPLTEGSENGIPGGKGYILKSVISKIS